MGDSPVLDEKALERLDEWGGEKLVHQMVRLCLENATTRLQQVDAALRDRRASDVERAAHSLKSSAANVGLVRLSEAAAALEDAAADGSAEHLPDLRSRLARAVDEARPVLEAHLRGAAD